MRHDEQLPASRTQLLQIHSSRSHAVRDKHFGGKMTTISGRKVNKSYEVYLALYQAVSGNEEFSNIYKDFSPTFFDLIIVGECHRGSAAEDSNWRMPK